jgi:predicted MPP superfamily phosphohydrolase
MLSLEDKLNILKWSFISFSVVVILAVAVSCYKNKGIPLLMAVAAIVMILGTLALVDMYWIEPNWIKIEQVVIHDTALAEVLEGVTVVQISDIHLQGGIGYRERELIEKVNALKPDLLFITGDFFSDEQKSELPAETAALAELIRHFRTTTGIFGVAGNYDGPLRFPAVREAFSAAGLDLLRNESRTVALPNKKCLYLLGVDGSSSKDIDPNVFDNVAAKTPTVLIAHYPNIFGKAASAGVNLVLAGHTHGGQIGIPFLVRRSHSANKSRFLSGIYTVGTTKMYVNRGIGTTRVPVRFFCRPEITVFRVEK